MLATSLRLPFDTTCANDGDADGFSIGDSQCPLGVELDCDDQDPWVAPGAAQVCDGLNNDCKHTTWPLLVDTNCVQRF